MVWIDAWQGLVQLLLFLRNRDGLYWLVADLRRLLLRVEELAGKAMLRVAAKVREG